jgi:hypothetical protein
LKDRFNRSAYILINIVIAQSNDLVTALLNLARALRVIIFAPLMRRAIQFDNHARPAADKINDISSNRLLPNKFITPAATTPKFLPKTMFSRNVLLSE